MAPHYGAGTGGVGVVSACANASVANPANAVDNDLSTFATFNSLAAVACPSSLAVDLEGAQEAPAGYYAGFVIDGGGPLDASVLSGLRLSHHAPQRRGAGVPHRGGGVGAAPAAPRQNAGKLPGRVSLCRGED